MADSFPMIARSYQHQWPQDFDRESVPYPNTLDLEPCAPRGASMPDTCSMVTTWCQQCQCDHGLPFLQQADVP